MNDSEAVFCPMPERAVLRVAGAEARVFLQGLVSADVTRLTPGASLWGAFLTPQGRYLHDFFLVAAGEDVLLETEAARLPDLAQRLSRYRLRRAVTLDPLDWRVGVVVGCPSFAALDLQALPGLTRPLPAGGRAFVDPRLAAAGVRLLLAPGDAPPPGLGTGTAADWHAQRLSLGLPDGAADLEVEKALLLENGFEELGGVSFTKGCYLGQEMTARTHYRGLIRRRLVPVVVEGPLPAPGTLVQDEAGEEVGVVRSGQGEVALAFLRLEALERPLWAGVARVTPRVPAWMKSE
ncbi:YgfZ/GcvT domain-containing protein [Pararhodospirillum photometricum]|nr:glycine cleavage system protein T [Pararhodospirillum photometricum]